MYVIVVGGGNVGFQLTKRLIARGHEVLLLEKDPRQALKLSETIGDQYILSGDGCELHVQKLAGFGRADVVVAATGEDEDNLVVSQLAKGKWNVERVVARVNDPEHESVFKDLGIDDTVSATRLIFNLIDQQLETDDVVPVGALHQGHVEVVEAVLSHRSPFVGKAVREISLPTDTFLVWLSRDGKGMTVSGETVFAGGDTVVAMVPVAQAEELRDALTSGT